MEGNFYPLLKWMILPPLAGFVLNGLMGKRLLSERAGGILGSLTVLLSFVFALLSLSDLLNLPAADRLLRDTPFTWISAGSFIVDFALRLDPLSAVMALIVSGVSFLIHVYSIGYMRGDRCVHKYFAYLNLFVFFMLLLVLADNPVLMFVGWEGVGLASYLLIGFWYEDPEKASAGKKAFVTNRIGDAGFLAGLMLLAAVMHAGGVYGLDFATLSANAHLAAGASFAGVNAAFLIGVLLFIGATGKSAQFPLYVWLPDAMAGPTPVSALIHAATMVTAGVYMLARMFFLYEAAPAALDVVLVTGCFTAFLAAVIAAAQRDIKKVLAYSTVSQLGYMFMAVGAGAWAAGVFHLATHAFFKALLFLAAGSVIHGLGGEQDLFRMGGLRKHMRTTFILTATGWLAISGVPPLAGFYSKDLILEKVFNSGAGFVWLTGLLTAALTAYYISRLLILAFMDNYRGKEHAHESPAVMTVPMGLLAALSVVGGMAGAAWLLPFLQPVAPPEHHSALMIAVSVSAAAAGIIAAFVITGRRAQDWAAAWPRTHRLVYNKFYVDEIYGALILKPLARFADWTFRVPDSRIIDGAFVNGTARLFMSIGRTLGAAQTGNAQFYAVVFMAGLCLLLAAVLAGYYL